MTSDQLFHTDADGESAAFVDVIDEGLEGDLDDRIPALRALLADGTDDERLQAGIMLASWGDEAGLRALIDWADEPDTSPVDEFGALADALRAARLSSRTDATEALRADAYRALLAIAADVDFGRDLGYALVADTRVRALVAGDVEAAAERAIGRLEDGDEPEFDLATQAAGLLVSLAKESDDAAAGFAERLRELAPKDPRVLRDLIDALGAGSGEATLAVLRRIAKVKAVRDDADAALARRARA
ncbi:hypothetical protein OJ997_33875 [Solirubrobacter phytolaccae]|uniref:Uncharacterized protein n=1 Tax=Solirubrobacter phytolaccae TaxID=1404360 RepID=A0A9X3SB88_9ACTN|nr:hypothetical protein [Solirubrobacter phytolaccae]MDA0185344.1 hypothetical protein [Solirubrobacter phytolaccae]